MYQLTKLQKENLATTSFVTGYWRIDNNQKKTAAHYQALLPRTLALLRGGAVIVVHDDLEFFDQCADLAKKYDVQIYGFRLPVTELPYYHLHSEMVKACNSMAEVLRLDPAAYKKDKGSRHFTRHLKQSGEEAYGRLISIWLSKIALVNREVIPRNPFGSENFAWMDVSVARFNHLRDNWNFTKFPYGSEAIHHYGTKSWYRNVPMKLNASFFYGNKQAWTRLDAAFDSHLHRHLHDLYAHDEETLLHLLMQEQPDLFSSMGQMRHPRLRQLVESYHTLRNRFFKI